jgi:hypothetical protein
MTNRNPLYFVLAIAILLWSLPSFVSCKHKDDDDDDIYTYSTSAQTTLIQNFSLQTDADVLANLDSVHFTIDYDNGLIYNADSLPVGTDITGLKVSVSFLNTVSSAIFSITGATQQADTTIEYTSSMTKELDFTGKTVLTVTSADKSQVKDYEIKVLVHKQNPDSLIWDQSWRRELPGYNGNAIAHKVVKQGDIYRAMVYTGAECQMLTADAPNQAMWEKAAVALPFVPQVSSLTATADALYVLAADGVLYTSPDGLSWASCGVTWHSILGTYDGRVLGIVAGEDGYYHDEFPRQDGFVSTAVEDGFPVAHASDMIETDNNWATSQQGIIVGGVDRNGTVLNDVWGYDGTSWGKINNIHTKVLPALADATLFSYYTYKPASGVRRYNKQPTWYLMGGRLADGTLNGKIYMSTTQGITWTVGDSTISQPAYMTRFYGAQAFVCDETLTAQGANGAPRRISQYVTSWECPFIFLFGGYNDQGALLPYVWRGVYNRLTNYPVE